MTTITIVTTTTTIGIATSEQVFQVILHDKISHTAFKMKDHKTSFQMIPISITGQQTMEIMTSKVSGLVKLVKGKSGEIQLPL